MDFITFVSMKEKKNILVTGGAGYIGSHTVVALINKGFTPIIVDDFRNAKHSVLDALAQLTGEKILCYKISCQDEQALLAVFNKHKIWGVIHFAADKSVEESVHNPLKYFENNLGGLISLLKVMKKKHVSRLVFSSSCTVYGTPEQAQVTEESPVSYASPYGFTKLTNEQMLEQFCSAEKDFKTVLLRYFNPVGAHDSQLIGEEPAGIPSNLLPYLTQTAAGVRECLVVYGKDYQTKDGTCIRDYIHVMDLAEAHVAALNYMEKQNIPHLDVFNIGTGKGTSVQEMISCFEQHCQPSLNWKYGKRRAGDVPEIYANASKAAEKLNWQARFSIKDAIVSAWNFELKQRTKDTLQDE